LRCLLSAASIPVPCTTPSTASYARPHADRSMNCSTIWLSTRVLLLIVSERGHCCLIVPVSLWSARGRRKPDYSSMTFAIWADSLVSLESIRDRLLGVVGNQRLREETFTIDWQLRGGGVGTDERRVRRAGRSRRQPDEAYPTLGEPIDRFIERYLAAPETVLILQGATRDREDAGSCARALASNFPARKGDSAKVLYTADTRALESDEIFVEFVTGSHDAFVIEDADHILDLPGERQFTPAPVSCDRLTVSSRAQDARSCSLRTCPTWVTLTTRAAAFRGATSPSVRFRALEQAEVERLLVRLCGSDPVLLGRAIAAALAGRDRSATLASIYRAEGAVPLQQPQRSGDKLAGVAAELNSIIGRPCAKAEPMQKPDSSGRADRAGSSGLRTPLAPSPMTWV